MVVSFNESLSVLITNPTYYAVASVIEIIILIIILYKWNPFSVSEKFPVLCSIFIMFVIFFQLMTYLFVSKTDNMPLIFPTFTDFAIKIIYTLATICFMVLLASGIIWLLTNFPTATTVLLYGLNLLIVIVLIALIYVLLVPAVAEAKPPEQPQDGLSLIKSLIMYIPCGIIDTVEWAKKQYNITTRTTWILLSIEFFIISLRILVPKITSLIVNSNSLQLLREPIYLNSLRELGSYEVLHKGKYDSTYIYSISAWFWINPQPPSTRIAYTKYTNIIEYGRKPAVEFNGLENTLRVNCQIKGDEEVTIAKIKDIKLQTWNNIVINYDGSTMDVFLNGELVGSKPNISPYITMENVKVGAEKGIEGGICNVVFYNRILQEREIHMLYKALREIQIPLV